MIVVFVVCMWLVMMDNAFLLFPFLLNFFLKWRKKKRDEWPLDLPNSKYVEINCTIFYYCTILHKCFFSVHEIRLTIKKLTCTITYIPKKKKLKFR